MQKSRNKMEKVERFKPKFELFLKMENVERFKTKFEKLK